MTSLEVYTNNPQNIHGHSKSVIQAAFFTRLMITMYAANTKSHHSAHGQDHKSRLTYDICNVYVT